MNSANLHSGFRHLPRQVEAMDRARPLELNSHADSDWPRTSAQCSVEVLCSPPTETRPFLHHIGRKHIHSPRVYRAIRESFKMRNRRSTSRSSTPHRSEE